MSTSCVYPLGAEHAFRMSHLAGFDGVEIMVTGEDLTRDAPRLREMSERYEQPILSIHAPVLLLTPFVWGRDPQGKLERAAEHAAAVGAPSVVVHPPFRWQASYARDFLSIVRKTARNHDVEIAVENMFPWKMAKQSLRAYAPSPDPTQMDCDAMTLDFSHASLAGRDSLELAMAMGSRLRHVHLCDGSGSLDEGKIFDQHLVPGVGTEPVAEVLEYLARENWDGSVVAEINTRKVRNEEQRLALLGQTLAFARAKLSQEPPVQRTRAPRPLKRSFQGKQAS
ncbi:sugar phosphate isomerase/epimerase family protein [Lysobacter korlensis]|uniref:Sugar phosphate isomerase/epimerase family protein n=1 Tax=Lysobacter korlensis TaxID=553636 RepID=A0ABV6RWI2_9GAMM